MTKRNISTWGIALFVIGLFVMAVGALMGNLFFHISGTGLALILVSFMLFAYGSRVGDQQK